MEYSSNWQKYQSKNPIRRYLIKNLLLNIKKTINEMPLKMVLDAGCGEGFTIQYLKKSYPDVVFFGIDVSYEAVKTAKLIDPDVDFKIGSVYSMDYPSSYFDLVICSEVLEHLEDPKKAILELKRVSRKYVLFSVPNEPWFRISSLLSGKYLSRLGNHPEHIQNWSQQEFTSLVGKYFKIEKSFSSFPWTVVLGSKF